MADLQEETPRVNVKKKIKTTSIGIGGERMINSFRMEEDRVDDLTIEDYRRMVDNDGQVQMIYNAITTAIHSAGLTVQDDPEVETAEPSEEKEFIERVLFAPIPKNGMATPIVDVNRTMLRAFIEGYRVFELVYKQVDNQVFIDRVAPRAATGDDGMKLIVNDNGHFIGFHQKTNLGSKHIDVTVKNTPSLLKVVKSTFGEEFGSLYGRSGLRAAWYHYDKVHKAMFLNHVGHEFGASKFRYVKSKGNMSEEEVDQVIETLSKVQQETVFVAPEDKMEVTFEELADPAVMAVGKDMINLHYSLIAKSVLAQFIDLGSTTSESGSRALGESQVDFFKEGLQGVAEILIERPWNQIIASLIRINFDRGVYPTLKVNKIRDDSVELLHTALLELTKKGNIPDSVKTQIIAKSGESIGLDVDEEDLMTEIEENTQKEQDREDQQAEMLMESKKQQAEANPQANLSEDKATHIHLQDQDILREKAGLQRGLLESKLVDEPMMRPLFPDEEKVKLVDIKNKLRDTEARARITLARKLSRQKAAIINDYLVAARNGRSSIRRQTVELQEENTYSEELLAIAFEMLEFGKISAANELDVKIPTTTNKDRQGVTDRVGMVVDEQEARLGFRLQNVANESLDVNRPENETELLLEEEYDNFFDTVLGPTIIILVPGMMNRGRGITFDKNQDMIFAFRYTAILDSRTTNFCRSLDGKVFQETDPDFALLFPPNHFGCRSIFTPITNKEQEEFNFVVDGKPNGLPVFSSVTTFEDPTSVILKEKERRILSLIDSVGARDYKEDKISFLINELNAENSEN